MTICSAMLASIDKRLAEKKTLEEIGCELCDAVDDPRGKAIRIIKAHRGEKYLIDNAEWLGYQVKVPKKFATITESNIEETIYPEPQQTNRTDSFEQNEIVYESEPLKTVQECCSYNPPEPHEQKEMQKDNKFIPTLRDVTICPCGCGCGYCEINKKWYNQVEIAQLDEE